jgi:uncharacterized membrane protein
MRDKTMIKRLIANLCVMPWTASKIFNSAVCQSIEKAIVNAELINTGEVRFVVEGNLDVAWILRGVSARQRAIELFSSLRIWDTEQNTGVLVYVLMSEHKIEIVADRGITQRVPQQVWDDIAMSMSKAFAENDFVTGSITGLQRIKVLLAEHFPSSLSDNCNELTNRILII